MPAEQAVQGEESDEEEALEIIEGTPLYPEQVSVDEQRRFAIFQGLASAEIDSEIQIKAAAQWERWLKDGEVPGQRKASLKTIRNND